MLFNPIVIFYKKKKGEKNKEKLEKQNLILSNQNCWLHLLYKGKRVPFHSFFFIRGIHE